MTDNRVFDDEQDRWIAVHEGETDRDALLRSRAEGLPAAAQRARDLKTTRQSSNRRRPNAALTALWLIGIIGVLAGAAAYSIYGLALLSIGATSILLALTVQAVRHKD